MDEILTKENIFYGYRRANGLVGIRNKVAILSAMDNVNPIVRTISNEVSGTIAITHNAG
ncbi:MAG: UxaA family hydrolase, partial [Atribacterota bacterium]|nr:UxaA family hydrolase [Atribacterota bacterium]